MGELDITKLDTTDLKTTQDNWEVESEVLDGITGDDETEYQIDDWPTKLGYYKKIPELNAAIDAKTIWTLGKGILADPDTMLIINTMDGCGIDTFETILENMITVYQIGGDSFSEIIRNDNGQLRNLKPLDPSTIKVIYDKKGRIKKYKQTSKYWVLKKLGIGKPYKPEEMFHLCRNRIGDSVRGQSLIDPVEEIIKMRNEAMTDQRLLNHRFVKPIIIFHLDTDDTTEIATIKGEMETAYKDGELLFVPKGGVVPEVIAVAPNATLNALQWIDSLNRYFYQATGGTDIVIGSAQTLTEASGKIKYLAFQQNFLSESRYVISQVAKQLGLTIEIIPPASLENEMLSDEKKDGNTPFQPNDSTAGSGQ
jgi:hypothetical protein